MDAGEIGPGDVVEATRDLPAQFGDTVICVAPKGARAVVLGVSGPGWCNCRPDCCGLDLEGWPLPRHMHWCPCGWRKVGGSQVDTVRQFEDALRQCSPRELEPA